MNTIFNRLTLFLICLLPVGLSAQSSVIDQVIARVGSEYVLLSELEEQYALAASQTNESLPPDARCQMLDQLLVGKLLYNQSKLDSIEVADSEVESQLNARIDRILSYMGGSIEQFEDYYGQSISATKEQFREDLREQIATDRIRQSVVQGVKVTPEEVKTFFANIPRDSLPYFNAEVEVGEIAVLPEANDETRKATVARLKDIRERIVNEEITFEEAARKYSADGSGQAGGDLGWTKRGKFVPEFEAAAYNLDPGELSDIVRSEFGYHLIKLQERRGNTIKVSHILLSPEITEADVEKSRIFLDSIANLVRVDSMSFSVAVKRNGFDKVQSYNNDGRMTNNASGNTFFEIGDLDPDIYFAIDEMEVGEISEVMEFKGPRGETMLRVVQLQSRSSPHRASLAQDYAKIQIATKSSKQQKHLSDWIEKTIGSTFVMIDERYKPCPSVQNWIEDSRKIVVGNK
ncbi:peptidylprolyl isomerase [Neolewinella aurantiaca]|uniref:Peptidylprolyl isomerase n=1 Tax=Neolewinella aurantiaca TaxID=2602767 RepID=A0A5C7FEX0_9BACT|nr:peptidylprolyl isomerase [Neolewinella aurantiaca]TXF89702.1 peptidylprolyl isomerase [Neolewinella aurantiaca]